MKLKDYRHPVTGVPTDFTYGRDGKWYDPAGAAFTTAHLTGRPAARRLTRVTPAEVAGAAALVGLVAVLIRLGR